jgi:hypothetical protein
MMVTEETGIYIKLGETNGQVRLQEIDLSLQQFSFVVLYKEGICNRVAVWFVIT